MNGTCARRTPRRCSGQVLPAIVAALAAVAAAGTSAQSTHDVSIVLAHVGERLEQYYKRVQNIICTEKTTTQPVSSDMTPTGFARIIESELRVELDAAADDGEMAAEPKIVRSVRKINGRAPRPKDKEACHDPNPLSIEPLAFLLPANRESYAFSWGGFGKGREQHLMIIEYRPLDTGKPSVKEHERDREGCLSFSMPGGTKGRIWIDAETHDVVRFEERLVSPVDFRIPVALQRRHNFPDMAQLARYDRYVKYKAVVFDDPRETLLLPESIDELAIWRGGGSNRINQRFTDYKRFLTGARVVK